MLHLEALTPERLTAFGELLGSDDFGGCFCAVWTAFGDDWAARCAEPARPNFHETERRVSAGDHVGFLVREGDEFVAWTGAGPKSCFPMMRTRLASRLTPDDDTWSIGCLAIRADHRGAGLGRRIVEAVIARARAAGASALEAYPTRPWDEPRSYRGAHSTYAALGFREQGSEQDGESEILLMRLELTG